MVTRLRELAEQSASGSYSNTQRVAINSEAQALSTEYNRIVSATQFNGISVFGQEEIVVHTGPQSTDYLTASLASLTTTQGGDGTFQSGIESVPG